MSDSIKHPAHYMGAYGMEAMDVIREVLDRDDGLSGTEKYWYGCAIKYIFRWPMKNGVEDIDKAIQCLYYLRSEVAIHDVA